MTRREWVRLLVVMIALVALGLIIVFDVGGGGGTPTQRTPTSSGHPQGGAAQLTR